MRTGEHDGRFRREIRATVVATPTSLSSVRDSTQELHEAGSIRETFDDAFYEETSDQITPTENIIVLTSTSLSIS